MFIFRYIKTLINIYLLYIQPILGMFLIGIGLWGFYAPDEGTCRGQFGYRKLLYVKVIF